MFAVVVEITGMPAVALGPFRSEERAEAMEKRVEALVEDAEMEFIPHVERFVDLDELAEIVRARP